MTKIVSSTFDSDLDGWTMNGDVAQFTWESSGGNPGGYAYWVDAATGADSYYVAPSKFDGDQSVFYGGAISYDIYDTGDNYAGVPDIELTGAGLTLVYVAGQPNTTWTHFSATLAAGSGWLVGAHDTSVSGDPAATEAQMREVLANLTSVEIRAEYVSGGEDGGLDNVVMQSAGASAWDLWSSPAKTDFLGAYSTFAAALAAAQAGDDLEFVDAGAGGGNIGPVTVKVDNLTVEADSTVTGTLALGPRATSITLKGAANLNVNGNSAANTITGNDGANAIRGNGGADTIYGGGGDDHIFITSTPTLVDGGAGTADALYILSGAVVLNDSNVANVELFLVEGGASLDFSGSATGHTITSQSTATTAATIVGSQGADRIHAGKGADSITGGAGDDIIYAGSGADTFHYDATGFGRDTINAVNLAKDTFDMSGIATSMANLHFIAVGPGGMDTKILSGKDSNSGDAIILIGVTPSQVQANGHFTF